MGELLYEDGSGYDTATVVEYQSKLRPPRFKVAFPSYLEYDDLSLSWEEVLAEKPCLNSNGEKARLVMPRPYDSLTPPPRARAPLKSYWDMREAAWYDYDGQKRVPRIDERTPQPSRIHRPYAPLAMRLTLSVLVLAAAHRYQRDEWSHEDMAVHSRYRRACASSTGEVDMSAIRRRYRRQHRDPLTAQEKRENWLTPAEKAARGIERPRFLDRMPCRARDAPLTPALGLFETFTRDKKASRGVSWGCFSKNGVCAVRGTLQSENKTANRAHVQYYSVRKQNRPTLSQFLNHNTGCWVAGLRIMSSYTTNPPPVHLHG